MKKRVLTSIVFVTLVFLLAACSSGTTPQAEPNTLTVIKVDDAALNASADFWTNAPKLEVSSKAAKEGNPDGPVVTLQAVHDGNNIVIAKILTHRILHILMHQDKLHSSYVHYISYCLVYDHVHAFLYFPSILQEILIYFHILPKTHQIF